MHHEVDVERSGERIGPAHRVSTERIAGRVRERAPPVVPVPRRVVLPELREAPVLEGQDHFDPLVEAGSAEVLQLRTGEGHAHEVRAQLPHLRDHRPVRTVRRSDVGFTQGQAS